MRAADGVDELRVFAAPRSSARRMVAQVRSSTPSTRSRSASRPWVAGGLRLHDIEADDRGVRRHQRVDQLGDDRARPRPAAELREAGVVDRDDDDVRRGGLHAALHEAVVDGAQVEQVEIVAAAEAQHRRSERRPSDSAAMRNGS